MINNRDIVSLIHKAIRYYDCRMLLEIRAKSSDTFKNTCRSLDALMQVKTTGCTVNGLQKVNFRQYINHSNQITVSVVEAV